jgi:hypothetical protein
MRYRGKQFIQSLLFFSQTTCICLVIYNNLFSLLHYTYTQAVYGKQMIFRFGDYRRPGQIAIYKSADFGRTFQPWHFMVTQQHECTTVFGIPESEIYILPDDNVHRVLCQQYAGFPYDFGETVCI